MLPNAPVASQTGTLEEFLAPDDILEITPLGDAEWQAIRQKTGKRLAWQFCTLRNLLVHRGLFTQDPSGFAWGGIFRSLLVGAIVRTSYRNEGHFRSGVRIMGTSDFFTGGFLLPRKSTSYREIVRMVNLRHHVAGVVRAMPGEGDSLDRVQVEPGYEADYAYVATAFIESIRRGLAMCGVRLDSPSGRASSEGVCQILYQLAGFTGLTRMPRDLAAHERFRDAYDRGLREHPASSRTRRMAQEIAYRIIPFTAVSAGLSVRAHVQRHLDEETAEYLFPGGEIPSAVEDQRREFLAFRSIKYTAAAIAERSQQRQQIWQRPDVTALLTAYRSAASEKTDDRLIGAVLLHALESEQPIERRTIRLAAGEPLIRQGATLGEMYVLLSATGPLQVLRETAGEAEPKRLAMLFPPTVLGEIGMWRNQPAMATVVADEAVELEVLVINADRFAVLKEEPGFRAATAAEVQRRLALQPSPMLARLEEHATASGDTRLLSIAQLMRFLMGQSHVNLDRVIDIPDDATPSELVEGLRHQVGEAVEAGGLPEDLKRSLTTMLSAIG